MADSAEPALLGHRKREDGILHRALILPPSSLSGVKTAWSAVDSGPSGGAFAVGWRELSSCRCAAAPGPWAPAMAGGHSCAV